MAEWSFPFADQDPDSEDGRPYTDAEIRRFHRAVFLRDTEATAFVVDVGNKLAVSNPAGVTIRVNSGCAFVDGFFYENPASLDLTATAAPAGLTYKNSVVLRADWSAFKCRLAIKEGNSISYPSMTQTRNVTWEMELARFTITDAGVVAGLTSMVTDENYAHFGTRVSAAMHDPRTRTLFVPCTGVRNTTDGTDGSRTDPRGWTLTDAKTCVAYGQFVVPKDYASGLAIYPVVIPTGAGDLYESVAAYYGAVSAAGTEAYNAHSEALSNITETVTADKVWQLASLTFGTAPAVDDLVSVTYTRTAGNVADTVNAAVYFVGWRVEYTADS